MIAAKLLIPKNTSKGMHTIKKMKLVLFSFHDKFLNFNENMGISETKSQEKKQTNKNR